jgi:ribosome biogenesis GTPase
MSDEKYWHFEEDYHSKDRKSARKERKAAANSDRSQYKKSDQDQLKKHKVLTPEDTSLMRGRVLCITADGITVDCDEKIFTCTLKGALKKNKSRLKNILAVGDHVWIEPDQATIVNIAERTSILSRADNLSRTKEQLIAVNIDQVIISCSVVIPPLKPSLIDRYIIAARKGNMEPIIAINKIDLLENPPPDIASDHIESEKLLLEELLDIYRNLDITVILVSTVTGEGIATLKEAMHGKTSVFSGQSGVGKSRLITCTTGRSLATGDVVKKTLKGAHTTTTTHLIRLDKDSFCIDTPGIKSFGLWDLKSDEIKDYFTEISKESVRCKFPDCKHGNEPECAVKKAVEEGAISDLRFASYCALMACFDEEHGRR